MIRACDFTRSGGSTCEGCSGIRGDVAQLRDDVRGRAQGYGGLARAHQPPAGGRAAGAEAGGLHDAFRSGVPRAHLGCGRRKRDRRLVPRHGGRSSGRHGEGRGQEGSRNGVAVRVGWALICSVSVAAAGCGRPPLRVKPAGNGVVVDVQTLGEYPTTVRRIRLTCSDVVIWEVKAVAEVAQIHRFTIRPGDNPCYQDDVSEPEFRVVVPADCGVFWVRRGERCGIEIWGGESALSRVSASFTL